MIREWRTRAKLKWKALLKRRQLDRDLDEELQFHLAMREEKLKVAGAYERDARDSALRAFGNAASLKERCRETWMLLSFERIWRDLRYAARGFLRTPGFALTVTLVMAFGIGASTALFTIIRGVLLKPLPFAHPDRLVSLYERNVLTSEPRNVVSGGVFEDWQQQAKSFEQMSVVGEDGANLSTSGGQLPEYVATRVCTHDFFPMLGVEPIAGRTFSADDDRPQASPTAVLTYGLWRRRFGGDGSIVGKQIFLDAKPYTVIGVLPAYFIYPDTRTQLWLPVYHEKPPAEMHALGSHQYYVWAGLRAGISVSQAHTELDSIQLRIHRDHPNFITGEGATVVPLQDDLAHDVKASLYFLLGVVGCVLLIACLNVASLFAARAASRRREISIRASLGAARVQLLIEQLAGSVLLACVGGAVGLAFSYGGVRWILGAKPDIPGTARIHIDTPVLLVAFAMTVLSGVVAGLVPAFTATRGDILSGFQESSRSVAGSQSRAQLRRALLAAEVSLTVLLLIGAGLLLKSFGQLRSVKMGCATDNVLTMSLALPQTRYATPPQRMEFFSQLLERVRSMPGVQAAAVVTVLPGQGHFLDNTFTVEGRPPLPPGQELDAVIRAADPEYFRVMNIPLIRGRHFTDAERLDRAKVVIVSESFVRQFFPNEDPLGKRLNIEMLAGGPHHEIVGVVADVRSWLNQAPEPAIYFPLYGGKFEYGSVVVRSAKDVAALALPIQTEIARMDSDLAVSDVLTMDQIIAKSTADAKFSATLVLLFAALALVLAAVGLYGVLSYLVVQRTSEIGIRIALGAQRPNVVQLMLFDGIKPALGGLLLGILAAAASARLIRDLLFGVQPIDATVFVGVALIVLVVGLIACVVPAWRAARLDALTALRCE